MKERILIVDALNAYFRAYIVDPSLSTNGQPIGGMKGFLKILNKLVRESKPDKIVICWDGAGGSKKRKATNKSYKEGRAPIRLNRDIRNLSESEEITNKIWQQTRLFEYLNEMPIIQFMYEGIEADDIIAYVQRHPSLQGSQKMIVSSDKDFFQLLDDETILHRPIQKENLNRNRIIEQYGIHPNNFALARAVVGDVSDNLPGIKGVGLGTIAKRFPFLAEEKSCTINALVKFCKENNENNLKAFTNIVEGKKLIAENYKMMQLYSPSISVQTKRDIDAIFSEFTPALNKTMIRKMFVEDGIGELSINDLFVNFKSLIYSHKEQQTT
jgi:5'-3' exonuclease